MRFRRSRSMNRACAGSVGLLGQSFVSFLGVSCWALLQNGFGFPVGRCLREEQTPKKGVPSTIKWQVIFPLKPPKNGVPSKKTTELPGGRSHPSLSFWEFSSKLRLSWSGPSDSRWGIDFGTSKPSKLACLLGSFF